MGIKTGKKALFTEINITPLTDIFLVLLIIMMVVAPTFQSVDNSITIPEVNSGVSIEQGKVVISVTKDGTIYVDSKRSSLDNLVADLIAVKVPDEKAAEVVVKADEKAKSSIIMSIMDAAQDAKYKKLIVAGEPLNKKDQKKLEDASKNESSTSLDNNVINGATTPLPQESQYEDWSD
jgi:biopolymer transport protein ExbD/biopolymer transport protein TolR